MRKFVSYEKLGKKQRRELDQKRRTTWGSIDPVTRRPDNPKAYNRVKARRTDDSGVGLLLYAK